MLRCAFRPISLLFLHYHRNLGPGQVTALRSPDPLLYGSAIHPRCAIGDLDKQVYPCHQHSVSRRSSSPLTTNFVCARLTAVIIKWTMSASDKAGGNSLKLERKWHSSDQWEYAFRSRFFRLISEWE